MTTLNMPGFVAEAALYQTKARYHLVSNYGAPEPRGQVFPQARKLCVSFHIEYDLYASPNGSYFVVPRPVCDEWAGEA